ncbi:MAG: serine/threonine-protein kinase, partial [Candidatus Limnocylindrales bacterium]
MDGRLIGGRYRLLEARAIGGSASVWRAIDERTGRAVAVKRLHPHLAGDEHAIERLRREATVMGAVEHPNVVPVRDIVVDADGPAIVMDYIDGRSLAEHLTEDGPLAESEALRIATEVADGLAAAHANGLVHRDVKPANILLGSDGRARITDFGIATEIDRDGTALTAVDGVVGTMRYLAPERLAGEPAVPATDVWGLGVVLYEMLTGSVPYPATTIAERAGSALHVPERPASVTASTWAVIERALASDPSLRYAEA